MQTHAGRNFNRNSWPLDLRVNTCLGPATMDYISINFGVYSWNHFSFRTWTTNRTHKHTLTDTTGYLTQAAVTASVGMTQSEFEVCEGSYKAEEV